MLSVSHWLERRAVFYWWCCNLQYVPFVKFLCVSFSSRILVSHVGCCEVIVLNIKHIQVSRGLLRGVRIWISSLSWNQLPRLFSIEVDKNRVHKWFTIEILSHWSPMCIRNGHDASSLYPTRPESNAIKSISSTTCSQQSIHRWLRLQCSGKSNALQSAIYYIYFFLFFISATI